MLKLCEIRKSYRGHLALDGVSLLLQPGVTGLLGPNGAGKSTLMNILTDNLLPDSGEVLFDGIPIRRMGKAYRRLLGFTPQQQGLYDDFTGRRFLSYMAALKEIPRKDIGGEVERTAGLVNLSAELDQRIGAYSGGMKQRLLIAQAVLGDPRLLIFDEPTAGLDPRERVRVRQLLASLAQERTVLVATHVVPDIESIADNVILLKSGRITASGPPEELIGRYAPGATLETVYMQLFDKEVESECAQTEE
ncbi:ATP-binding cassette domain-containing protein [Zongyangia hominis]|uniref:ATP-binding cassette domain-containing protein n=1 Tax=Zongyangia hominis TaxID=2763677 RepID=A0A926IAR4_9FIRM|nr:ATP-binding cassette domain-containing protein [Zongyangia hominis]MBC8570481.1 ATP-binding cassette domain-containing protein [Zongyangia hominis]